MVLGPVVAGLLLAGTATPAPAAPAAELITPIAPSGFTAEQVPGTTDGSFDLEQMAKLAGVDAPTGMEDVGWDGAVRMWSGPGSQVAMVIAGRTKDAATAQEAAQGALSGALDADGASTFASSLPGVDGAIATKGIARAEFVAWSQDRYVSIAVTATSDDDTHALIDDLVTHQSDFLRTRYGVTPVGNAAPDSGIDLRMAGAAGLLLLALVAIGVGLARRHRSAADVSFAGAPFAPAPPGAPAPGAYGMPVPPVATVAPRPAPAPIPFARASRPAPTAAPPAPAPAASTPPTAAPPPLPAAERPATGPASWDDRFPQ